MKQSIFLILSFFYLLNISAQESIKYNNHNLSVKLDIANSQLDVTDTIELCNSETQIFYLNPNLSIYESNCKIEKLESGKRYTKYEILDKTQKDYIVLKYKGLIANNKNGIQNITHKTMHESTTGIIFDKGIYLGGQTYWVPDFETANLKTFSIQINIDKDWLLTSQGNIVAEEIEDSIRKYSFVMNQPTNQVCLVGNKWTKYTKTIKNVDINVYLITPDSSLAQRYLGVTSEYMDLYNNTIGAFPYSKFDVIENFWESGYGMPSFTLLGKRVMRFPWILNSSYPHELLHNYWGNSVYVDYSKGNWCEGITAYMADHLIKEKDDEGDIYRRAQLKKYTDYVNPENDFAPNKFKSKYNAASEAIGYSKVLMTNHMLRIKYGTDTFLKAYADFYQKHQFETASFDDIKKSFEQVTGDKLDDFFNQWINSIGAPSVELKKVKVKKKKGQYILNIKLSQLGTTKPYVLDIPVYIYLNNNKKVERKVLQLNNLEKSYSLSFANEPIRIDIDPMFDVMRNLDSQEVPPTLSQILGSKKWTIILPKSSKAYFHYKNLAISWTNMYSQRGIEIKMVNDNKIETIPTEGSVWILGSENKFAQALNIKETYGSMLDEETISNIEQLNANELIVYTMSNPENKKETIGYINSNNPSSVGQLNMKFMHYSNFSYFGFDCKSFESKLKGNFPVLESPLKIIINDKHTIDWSKFVLPAKDYMYR